MKSVKKITSILLCMLTIMSVCVFASYAAPSASNPTAIKAEAGIYSVRLIWPVNDDTKLFHVYQNVSGKWVEIKSGKYGNWLIKNLKPNTSYTFGVRAEYFMGPSNSLNPEYKTVTVKTLPEVASPKFVPATSSYQDQAGTIRLDWEDIKDAAGYRVYIRVNGAWKLNKLVKDSYCEITGLTAGTKYEFAVKHYYVKNGKTVLGKAYGTCFAQTGNLDAMSFINSIDYDENKTVISWNALSGASGYRIYRKVGVSGSYVVLGTVNKNTLSFTDNSRYPNKTYYAIRAYARTDKGIKWSKYSVVSVPAYIPVFKDMSTLKINETGANTAELSWDAVPNASGYFVFKKIANGSWVSIKNGGTGFNSFTVDTKPSEITYYLVRAYAISGSKVMWSDFSNYVTVYPELSSMGALEVKDIETGGFELDWDIVAGALGYRIYKKEVGGSWQVVNTVKTDSCVIDADPSVTTYYMIRAYGRDFNGIIWSGYSNYVTVTA